MITVEVTQNGEHVLDAGEILAINRHVDTLGTENTRDLIWLN